MLLSLLAERGPSSDGMFGAGVSMQLKAIAVVLLFLIATPVLASTPTEVVRTILQTPDSELSYERAKLAFDKIIDPQFDQAAVVAEIDRLAKSARDITASETDVEKLKAIRQTLYDAGRWNFNSPFAYDHNDPYGRDIRSKLLATYMETRRGNCVSMPILHLIVGERLGLNVSLSTAPLHIFLRYTNPQNGRSIAIEPTSGGHPAREQWYRERVAITDTQVNSGIYLAQLSKRESIALMASTVTEWLMSEGRYQEAIDVADIVLKNFPKDVHALLTRASAHGEILKAEFDGKYPSPSAIPPPLRLRHDMLAAGNMGGFAKAESWGWTPPAPVE